MLIIVKKTKIVMKKNFAIVNNIFQYCKNKKIKIIQISTDQVYDSNKK